MEQKVPVQAQSNRGRTSADTSSGPQRRLRCEPLPVSAASLTAAGGTPAQRPSAYLSETMVLAFVNLPSQYPSQTSTVPGGRPDRGESTWEQLALPENAALVDCV